MNGQLKMPPEIENYSQRKIRVVCWVWMSNVSHFLSVHFGSAWQYDLFIKIMSDGDQKPKLD